MFLVRTLIVCLLYGWRAPTFDYELTNFLFFGLLSGEHEDPNFDWRRSGKNCEEADGCKFIPRKAIAGFCSSLTFPPFLIVRVWIGGSR